MTSEKMFSQLVIFVQIPSEFWISDVVATCVRISIGPQFRNRSIVVYTVVMGNNLHALQDYGIVASKVRMQEIVREDNV